VNEHPSADIVGTLGSELAGKTIVLGITGSVAAVRSSDLARLLMRHGADVRPVMTRAACDLIHPNLLEWATGHKPIVELTGAIEHVDLVGNVPIRADLLVIAPATANTIGKMACGIDDSPVTTFFTTAFGEGVPVVLVPAMHRSMYDHPFVVENLAKLDRAGVKVLMPRVEEGKAKIADEESVYQAILAALGPSPLAGLAGKHVVVTAGRTVEYLDPIRVLTNNSTGRMGLALAAAAHRAGARVTVVAGKVSVPVPPGVELIRAETASAMFDACRDLVTSARPDVFLAAAAVGDWTPAHPSAVKLPTSDGRLVLELVPTPKILDRVKEWSPSTFVVAFRAQAGLDDPALEADARARLSRGGADLIAANDTSRPGEGFETETNALTVIDRFGHVERISLAGKAEVAEKLLAKIVRTL
jgi:phosphopantothenoylcysteine decarboxylase/phosphopantothenate--cysteine ligase